MQNNYWIASLDLLGSSSNTPYYCISNLQTILPTLPYLSFTLPNLHESHPIHPSNNPSYPPTHQLIS